MAAIALGSFQRRAQQIDAPFAETVCRIAVGCVNCSYTKHGKCRSRERDAFIFCVSHQQHSTHTPAIQRKENVRHHANLNENKQTNKQTEKKKIGNLDE